MEHWAYNNNNNNYNNNNNNVQLDIIKLQNKVAYMHEKFISNKMIYALACPALYFFSKEKTASPCK